MKTTLILLLASVTLATARIGETPEQCAERYGEPMILEPGQQIAYLLGDYPERKTFVDFGDGKAIKIKFAFELSPEAIRKILAVNGKDWKLVKPEAPMKTWKSSDGRKAILMESLTNVLIIEHTAKVAAKEKANEEKALEGF